MGRTARRRECELANPPERGGYRGELGCGGVCRREGRRRRGRDERVGSRRRKRQRSRHVGESGAGDGTGGGKADGGG